MPNFVFTGSTEKYRFRTWHDLFTTSADMKPQELEEIGFADTKAPAPDCMLKIVGEGLFGSCNLLLLIKNFGILLLF